MDAGAIVIDPQVPEKIQRVLKQAPPRRLIRFAAAAPAVVPATRGRRRDDVLTPQAKRAATTAAVMLTFFVATVTAWLVAVAAQSPNAALVGSATLVVWLPSFIATASAMKAAAAAGWRQPRATADPEHPAWDGLHAVTAYHRKYVKPGWDMDPAARALWTRAADAANKLGASDAVRSGLVDSVHVSTVLPYLLWDIVERLAQVSALRGEHRAILGEVDEDDPSVAALLVPQRQAHELADADIECRVSQLEAFARLVGQADAARARERAVRQLATLNDSHTELLARISHGNRTGSDGLAEQLPVDVQMLIDQADEAIERANEAGRGL